MDKRGRETTNEIFIIILLVLLSQHVVNFISAIAIGAP